MLYLNTCTLSVGYNDDSLKFSKRVSAVSVNVNTLQQRHCTCNFMLISNVLTA